MKIPMNANIKNARNAMLVTVSAPATASDDFIAIKTYDAGIGSRGRFLVSAEALAKWFLHDSSRPYMDTDCNHILRITKNGGKWSFTVWWMSDGYSSGGFYFRDGATARIREFALSTAEMCDLFVPGLAVRKTVSLRTTAPAPQVKLEFTEKAMTTIGKLNKAERTAFRKFLRGAFLWPDGGEITVCDDGGKSFFFRERGGICGGIVLHRTMRKGHPALAYEMHT